MRDRNDNYMLIDVAERDLAYVYGVLQTFDELGYLSNETISAQSSCNPFSHRVYVRVYNVPCDIAFRIGAVLDKAKGGIDVKWS